MVFMILSFFSFFFFQGTYRATEACWYLCSFERRAGTCFTHKLPGFAVGWEFILLQSSVFWANVQWCWGACVQAGMRRGGMRKWSTCCQLMVYSEVSESKQEGEKKKSLSEILFWVYCMCCSWSSPGGGKKLFLWPTLLWSAWALSPFLIFSEVFLWNWLWKTRWLILFCELWSWQYGVFMCAFSVPFENKVLSLYKQAISFGWSGFSMGCQVSFSLKWNSGLLKVLGPALLRKERKILKCGQKCCLLHRAH